MELKMLSSVVGDRNPRFQPAVDPPFLSRHNPHECRRQGRPRCLTAPPRSLAAAVLRQRSVRESLCPEALLPSSVQDAFMVGHRGNWSLGARQAPINQQAAAAPGRPTGQAPRMRFVRLRIHPGHALWKNYRCVRPSAAIKVQVITWASTWHSLSPPLWGRQQHSQPAS